MANGAHPPKPSPKASKKKPAGKKKPAKKPATP